MAHTKQTKKHSDDKGEIPKKQPSRWGTAAKGMAHRPPTLPRREDGSGNVSYIGTVVFIVI